MSDPGTMRAARWASRIVPAALLLVVGLSLFPVSGSDDKYITYWSARSLATTGHIVNYNGDYVEQSSSLTQVVMLAAVARLVPLPMPAIGWLVSVLFGMLTIPLAQRLAAKIRPDLAVPAGLVAGSAVSLVYWTFGGLETPIAAFGGMALVLAGLGVLRDGWTTRRVSLAALITLLFVGLRPENVFVASALWCGLLLLLVARLVTARQSDRTVHGTLARRALVLLALSVSSFAMLALFRWWYFGDIVPQPVRAKVGSLSLSIMARGFRYWFTEPWARWDLALWPLAIIGAVLAGWRSLRERAIDLPRATVALFFAAQIGFVTFGGGDWMEAGRFLAPIVPAASVLAVVVLFELRARILRHALLAAVVGVQLCACGRLAWQVSPSGPIWATPQSVPGDAGLPVTWFDSRNRMHVHLMPATAALIRTLSEIPATPEHPVTVMSGQMGFMPYYVAQAFFGRVRFIDLGGLCTRDVTTLAETAHWRTTQTGIGFRYFDYFNQMDSPRLSAPWIPTDILVDYDLAGGPDASRVERAAAHGYSIVFRQSGFPSNGSAVFPGLTGWRDAFVAVRHELAETAGVQPAQFSFRRPGSAPDK
jgi:hypothetical protein